MYNRDVTVLRPLGYKLNPEKAIKPVDAANLAIPDDDDFITGK